MSDVVAISDERNLEALQVPFGLPDGEIVGHGLAGMAVVCEPIDHRNAGELRHLLDDFVGKRANHDALHHALEILGHVVNRFALAKINFRWRKINRKASQLLNADVERHARAQRRLLENHRQGFAFKRLTVGGWMSFDLPCEDQQVLDFGRREVFDREKIFPVHMPAPTNVGSCSITNRANVSASPGFVSSSTSYVTRRFGLSMLMTRVRSIGVAITTRSHGVRRIVSSSS